MSKKTSLIIFILAIIFLLQFYYICNKTYSGYMFNNKYKMEKINVDYVVLSYNLLTIKELIDNSNDTVMSVFINDVDNKYNLSLQYWFNKRNFYPIVMPKKYISLPLSVYSDEEFGNIIIEEENDYVVLVGKNSSILNVTTNKDISLYKVISQTELELVYDFDNTLYGLQKNYEKFNKSDEFIEAMNLINNYIDNYSSDYGMAAYEYIYEYAEILKDNNEEDKALIYYQKYLNASSLEPDVLLNKAQIYQYIGDYDNAHFMINSCKELASCDLERANEIENSMEEQV